VWQAIYETLIQRKVKNMKQEVVCKINGVDTTRMQETIAAIRASPELGRFEFRIENRWVDAGENRSRTKSFRGGAQEVAHKSDFTMVADEPEMLLGSDKGANPVEHLLHALASCVTTSMVYHAAARGIAVEWVESSLEGDLDLQGFLGLDPTVRNGFQQIRMKLRIKGDLTDEQVQELGSLGPTFSPVYDSIAKGVPISLSAERMG